jgi:hypothetical protein
MEQVLQMLNQMQADGVIENYAIGGGIAAIYYLEPYQTDDIDIFIPVSSVSVGEVGLISLEKVYGYLKKLGYLPSKEGVMIEDWLVQFIPTSQPRQEEAIANSQRVRYGETETSIFTAEHLAAELLFSGRRKDQLRVIALIESKKVNMKIFREIINRHGLTDKWETLAKRFDMEE